MRFSFYTDLHLTDNKPKYRIDNYLKALTDKLKFIYETSVEKNCTCVTFGGDFFDRQRINDYTVIYNAIKTINDSGLKTYACIGEHDLYGHNPDTFSDSALAFLCNFTPSFINLWEPIHLDNGISFYHKHEFEKMEDLKQIKVDNSRYNILLCHELLYNKKMPFGITNTADLDLQFDLVCSGDLHCGFAPHKVKNTWYCNPSSIARKTTADMNRIPKFFIIDVQKGYDPIIQEQIIPSGNGNDVFSKGIGDILRGLDSNYDISNFIKGFENIKNTKTDIFEHFDNFLMKNSVKKDIVEYILSFKNKQSNQ